MTATNKSTEATVITTKDDALKFLREKMQLDGKQTAEMTKFKMNKAATEEFYAAVGVPKPALQQMYKADELLHQGMHSMLHEELIKKINDSKKAGIDVKETRLQVSLKATTAPGFKSMVGSSCNVRKNNLTGATEVKYGRVKIKDSTHKFTPKADREALVEDCRKACS